jgi:hypothetical protein
MERSKRIRKASVKDADNNESETTQVQAITKAVIDAFTQSLMH